MPPGPFNANIMPVKATYHWDDINSKWVVKVSRMVKTGAGGVKRELSRNSFDDYAAALSYVSVYWGNS